MEKYSKTELILLNELKKLGLNPEHQYKIDKLTVDFAFPKKKIAIEIDGLIGEFHHGKEPQKRRDGNRDDFLQSQGWKVRRFTANETYENPSKVAYQIKKFIERNDPDKDLTNVKYLIAGGLICILTFAFFIFVINPKSTTEKTAVNLENLKEECKIIEKIYEIETNKILGDPLIINDFGTEYLGFPSFKLTNTLGQEIELEVKYTQIVGGRPLHYSSQVISIPAYDDIRLKGSNGYDSNYNSHIDKESVVYSFIEPKAILKKEKIC